MPSNAASKNVLDRDCERILELSILNAPYRALRTPNDSALDRIPNGSVVARGFRRSYLEFFAGRVRRCGCAGPDLIAEIDELVKVRNQVVHGLLSVHLVKLFGFGFISDAVTNRADINRSHEWRDRDDKLVVTATDLDHCTMRANEAAPSGQRLIKPGV